ncbi:MAG: hypothetical protein ACQEXJ_06390 [Myxococcota bacterium]
MTHLVFAEFDDRAAAEATLEALRESHKIPDSGYGVIDHPGEPHQDEFPFTETEARRGLLWAGALGAGIGAVLGALLVWPLGLLSVSLGAGVAMGAGAGLVYAALYGLLQGAGSPHHDMEELAEELEEGQVLLTFEARTDEIADELEDIARALGATYVGREGHVHGEPHGPEPESTAGRGGREAAGTA